MFTLLQTNYATQPQLALVNCAITDYEGTLTMRRIDPAAVTQGLLPKEALGITTGCVGRGIMTRADYQEKFAAHVIEFETPCMPLQKILDLHNVQKIDVIVIDTEGADWMIAQQIDFVRYKTSFLCIEYSSLKADEIKDCSQYMSKRGYGLALCQEDLENMIFYKQQETVAQP